MSTIAEWLHNYAHINSDAYRQSIVFYNKYRKYCAHLPHDTLAPFSICSAQSNNCGKIVPDDFHYFASCLFKQHREQYLSLPIYNAFLYILCN